MFFSVLLDKLVDYIDILVPEVIQSELLYSFVFVFVHYNHTLRCLSSPYWKVRMLRQRSLACRNYICAKIWRIISLKSECSRFGVA